MPSDSHYSSPVDMFNHSSTLSPRRLRFLESAPVDTLQWTMTDVVRWSQSDSVDVLVGLTQTRFRIPSDFLTKRSEFFRTTLNSSFQEASARVVSLPTTAERTFEHVTVWLMSPQPEFDSDMPFLVTVDIAVFATIYLFDAMLHQALDLLRAHITSHLDVLNPEIVEHIYGQVGKHSLLRHLIRAALPVFTQAKITDTLLEEWMEAIDRCEGLGADFFYVQMRKWTLPSLLQGGPCRFHRHAAGQNPGISFSSSTFSSGTFCSRSAEECFEQATDRRSAGTRDDVKVEDDLETGKNKKEKLRKAKKVGSEHLITADSGENLQALGSPGQVETERLTPAI